MKTKSVRVLAAAIAVTVAACGASAKTSSKSGATSTPGTAAPSGQLGVGVSATTITVGIALVDFNCIKQFVDTLRVDQQQVYQAYIDDVNEHGGINGRKIVAIYKSYCPIQDAPALALCTAFTDDDHVFAVIGTFTDFSGDAQRCVTTTHQRVLLTHVVSQSFIDAAPPGLLITPEVTPERRASIVLGLLKRSGTLNGKTVAVLGEQVTQARVRSVIEPGIKALGVRTGTTAILSIAGADTTAAQSQLDAFIERWKTENVNAVFMVGDQVSNTQFIQKLRAAMPNLLLVSDTDAFGGYAQDAEQAGIKPNPYEGALTAEGLTGAQHDQTSNWKTCVAIYEKQTGKTAPTANEVVNLPGGKHDGTHDTINDACSDITMFAAIARRVGPVLNNANWEKTVSSFGSVPDMENEWGSLHAGKYDADDTFGLAAFDSSIPPKGDFRSITPVVDTGSS
jgi:ABC-type branched-subunit amino acid transport system substrate-binding protein